MGFWLPLLGLGLQWSFCGVFKGLVLPTPIHSHHGPAQPCLPRDTSRKVLWKVPEHKASHKRIHATVLSQVLLRTDFLIGGSKTVGPLCNSLSHALHPVRSEVSSVLFSIQKTYSWKHNGLSCAQNLFPKIQLN